MAPYKSLYTPIFHPTSNLNAAPSFSSSSSSSSSVPPPVSAYIDSLKQTHLALASLPPSYNVDTEHEHEKSETWGHDMKKRVDAVSRLVGHAEADGGRGSGKWGLVWEGVRMGCTRRYRVTAPSPAVQEEDEEKKWVLPETEKEWQEWQKQWEGEFKVKRKVEIWKAGVENGEEAPMSMREHFDKVEVEKVRNENEKEKGKGKESQSQGSSLGFPVVKRSSTTLVNAVNGKKPAPHKKTSSRPNHASTSKAATPNSEDKEATLKPPSSKHQPKPTTVDQHDSHALKPITDLDEDVSLSTTSTPRTNRSITNHITI
jgi:hypothetical protein